MDWFWRTFIILRLTLTLALTVSLKRVNFINAVQCRVVNLISFSHEIGWQHLNLTFFVFLLSVRVRACVVRITRQHSPLGRARFWDGSDRSKGHSLHRLFIFPYTSSHNLATHSTSDARIWTQLLSTFVSWTDKNVYLWSNLHFI